MMSSEIILESILLDHIGIRDQTGKSALLSLTLAHFFFSAINF